MAWGRVRPSVRCTKSSTSPLAPQPKQWKRALSPYTVKLASVSSWKGHKPWRTRPWPRRCTPAVVTTSASGCRCLSAAKSTYCCWATTMLHLLWIVSPCCGHRNLLIAVVVGRTCADAAACKSASFRWIRAGPPFASDTSGLCGPTGTLVVLSIRGTLVRGAVNPRPTWTWDVAPLRDRGGRRGWRAAGDGGARGWRRPAVPGAARGMTAGAALTSGRRQRAVSAPDARQPWCPRSAVPDARHPLDWAAGARDAPSASAAVPSWGPSGEQGSIRSVSPGYRAGPPGFSGGKTWQSRITCSVFRLRRAGDKGFWPARAKCLRA